MTTKDRFLHIRADDTCLEKVEDLRRAAPGRVPSAAAVVRRLIDKAHDELMRKIKKG